MNHNEYAGYYAGAGAREAQRFGKHSIAKAHRELEAAALVGGDISAMEIERRYQAAMREIRQRRYASTA